MLVCGLDEVGRGALAGPLMAVAALFRVNLIPRGRAVGKSTDILEYPYGITPNMNLGVWGISYSPVEGVNDSKKLTVKKRDEVFHRILRCEDLVDFGIGEASVEEINANGINWANETAFKRAVRDLNTEPDFILVDGTSPVMGWDINSQRYEPKADGTYWQVAAASILAKVIRDSYMSELATDYPQYKWDSNVGYGSTVHKQALKEKGACGLHRTKFVEGLI